MAARPGNKGRAPAHRKVRRKRRPCVAAYRLKHAGGKARGFCRGAAGPKLAGAVFFQALLYSIMQQSPPPGHLRRLQRHRSSLLFSVRPLCQKRGGSRANRKAHRPFLHKPAKTQSKQTPRHSTPAGPPLPFGKKGPRHPPQRGKQHGPPYCIIIV